MEKKCCPYCKSEQEVYPRGTFAIQLVDGSRIVEYQCTKCGRVYAPFVLQCDYCNNRVVIEQNTSK